MTASNRARVGYVNVVLAFTTLVVLSAVSPYLFRVLDMLRSQVSPLTSALLGLLLPMLIISMLYSIGVGTR